MQDELILKILEAYDSILNYAICVDEYIAQYMDNNTYTLDDVEGILYTMPAESIQFLYNLKATNFLV